MDEYPTDEEISTMDIELAVAQYFNPRQNLIVPNIHWGMFFNHECDLFILTNSGYGYEVEIKISKQDLINDLKKKHSHNSYKIKKLYFAIPNYLKEHIDLIPVNAGVLLVEKNPYDIGYYCRKIREAKNKGNYKFTDIERFNLARLGTMRIWTLKSKIQALINSPLLKYKG